MSDIDGRFTLGSVLVAFGLSYIITSFTLVHSLLWTFLGLFLLFEGVYFTVKKIYLREKDVSSYLSLLFIGISILLFTFNIIQYSFLMLVVSLFVSIGLALLISGTIFKFSTREFLSGVILIAIGFMLLIPHILNISDSVYKTIEIYGFGGIFIALGIVVMLPRKGGKK